jgi:CheY-like chemotaxis protein
MTASNCFDAVISEAALPGIDGHEMAWHVAARYPGTKAIFLTATNVECEMCPHAVKCPWIAKPFARKELVKRIAEILGESPRPFN